MLPEILPMPGSLLADLLEDSAALYHRNVAIIQRVFAEQYFQALSERQANGPSVGAEDVGTYRQALKAKQDELVRAQCALRLDRDANIRAFVASRTTARASAA
jgi:hypothetical protein